MISTRWSSNGNNETMPGPNGNNSRPQQKMPGTTEQLKSNQCIKRRFVPLPKIRCVPLPELRRCVPAFPRRRSVPPHQNKKKNWSSIKKKKMCSFATTRSHGTWTTDSCCNVRATALGPQHDEFNLCGSQDCADIQTTNAWSSSQ